MRFLIRVILIVVVAMGVAIGGLMLLPGDRIAQIAASQISKQTGRAVEISSDSSISLYPTLGITTGRAVIGSTDWAEEGPLFETDSLAIGIDVSALLTGTIRVSKLEATSPRITLERAEDGRANWEFSQASTEDSAAPQPATDGQAETADGEGYDFSLEQAIITNATLRYVDRQTGTVQAFENVDLAISWPRQDGAAEIALGASPFGERIDLNATVGNVLGIVAGSATPLSGTLKTGDAEATFAGTASLAPSAVMQLTLAAPDASQLLRAAGQTPQDLGLPGDFSPTVSAQANVTFDGARMALRDVSATVDGSSVAGDADITLAEALQVTANLTVDAQQVGTLMRMAGQAPENFGLDPAFDPAVASQVALQMQGTTINAKLTGLSASMEDATAQGDVDVALENGVPQVDTTLQLNVPDAARIAALVGQPLTSFGLSGDAAPSVSGTVTAQVNGRDVSAKVTNLTAGLAGASASGALDVAIADGVPTISGQVTTAVPDVAQVTSLVGQPLTGFGLPASAAPAFSGQVDVTMQGDVISAKVRDMVAAMAGATASGSVDVAVNGGAPSASGQINAKVPNTAQLLTALGQGAPDIPRGFGQAISANTGFNYAGTTLALSGMTLSLDQNTFSGSASLGLGGARPTVNASLGAGALDFSSLGGGSDAAPAPAGSGWSTDPIDASALGLINGNIALTASSIDLGTLKVGRTNVGVAIDNSRAVVSINELQGYQGSFAGQVVANNRNGLSVAAKLNVASVALQPLLTSLAGIDKIAGNANANVDILGVGNSVDAIMKSLSGSLSMSVPEGTIAGIDMDGLMRSGNPNASLTPFNGLQASGAIQNGVLVNNDLTAVTGRVDVTGDGQINLGGQSIDYTVTPVLKEVGDKERVSIPVRLRGPWSNISILPDLERALELEAERELKKLEEEARQRVEAEKEKLRQQAEAEKERLRQKAQEEARKLEEQAKAKAAEAARRAAEKLKLDQDAAKRLEDAARDALGNELNKGLRGLLGGN